MEEKEEKQETVTQPEKKTEETVTESVEKTEKVNEKTFTQDEVNAMLAKEKKKMPSSEELKAFKEWKENHEEEVHGLKTSLQRMNAQGASGGRYSYIFYPTAIGCSGVVKCNSCGEEFEFCEIG